jgi:hypothetical protein
LTHVSEFKRAQRFAPSTSPTSFLLEGIVRLLLFRVDGKFAVCLLREEQILKMFEIDRKENLDLDMRKGK